MKSWTEARFRQSKEKLGSYASGRPGPSSERTGHSSQKLSNRPLMVPRNQPWPWKALILAQQKCRRDINNHHLRRLVTTSTPDQSGIVGTADPTGYCKDLVRKHDYESFLMSQFYPKELQSGYFALKAFSVCRVSTSFSCFGELDVGLGTGGSGYGAG
jgi:hypothetical protein